MKRDYAGKKKPTVLLIDDEASWLDVISTALEGESYRIITADSGPSALTKMHKNKPDLILSDLRMPTMNGYELFEQVRKDPALRNVPYVFMSSIDDFEAKRVAKDLGADDYITKPYDMEEAKTVVLDLLTRFKTRR